MYAIRSYYARIVVFEISGAIVLTANLAIRNPFVTVAGQTASDSATLDIAADVAGPTVLAIDGPDALFTVV